MSQIRIMLSQQKPRVSIIIVNYNGQHLLEECLSSVFKSTYPAESFEVILVDNNSTDNSVSFVKRHFPKVIVLEASSNLGFTGGNNLGAQHATGEYIVLLNSDTRVEPAWLAELVAAAKPDSVGIVSSKLLFDIPFITVTIQANSIPKSSIENSIDFSPIGIILEDITCRTENLTSLVWYESGFYEKKKSNLVTRWTTGTSTVLLPFQDEFTETYKITLHGYPSLNNLRTPISILINNKPVLQSELASKEVTQFDLVVHRKDIESSLQYRVQNAGNILLSDGFSKDRGSIVRLAKKERIEFYEADSAYYEQPKKLLAACGAACLIKRSVIDAIDFLDGYYFMYYEDTDFSFRTWKMGWDILYEPNARVYHKHKASTGKVESVFFLHMVEKNHLFFVLTHYPLITVLCEVYLFFARLLITVLKFNVFRFRDNIQRTTIWKTKAKGRILAAKSFLQHVPKLIHNRIHLQQVQKRSYEQAKEFIY